MEPFKICCVTCQARLTVRNEEAIGKIVACPKCGSMVQIARPAADAGPQRAATVGSSTPAMAAKRSVGTSATLASADFSGVAEAVAPPPSHSAVKNSVVKNSAATVAAASEANVPPFPADPPRAAAASASVAEQTRELEALGGADAWRLAAVVLSAAVGGAILVATAVNLLRGVEPELAAAPPPAGAEAPTSVTPGTLAKESPPRDSAADAAAAETPDKSSSGEIATGTTAPASPDAVEVARANSTSESRRGPAVRSTEPPRTLSESSVAASVRPPNPPVVAAEPPATQQPPAPGAENSQSPRRLTIDPLNVDPEGLDLSLLTTAPPKVEFDGLAPPELPVRSEGVAAASSPRPEAARAATPQTVSPKFDPLTADQLARLASRKFPQFAVDDLPLHQLLSLVAEVSGVPVSVAPRELRLAGVGPAAATSVDAADVDAMELLRLATRPLRLQPELTARGIVVVRRVDDRRREISLPIDDLAPTPDAAQRLAKFVSRALATGSGEEAASVEEVDVQADAGSLRIAAPAQAQYEALVLIERYRVAAGLPPRSKYPRALLGPIWSDAALQDRLAGPATFSFVAATPLAETVRHWQRELGAPLLVDWPALASLQLAPQSPTQFRAQNVPWKQALDETLGSLGMGWRACGAGAIEITSRERVEADLQVDVFRYGDNVDAAAWLRQLEVPAELSVIDAAKRVALVRATAPVLRRLAELLDGDGAP